MGHSRGHVAIGVAALIALGQASLATEPADDSAPAASNVPGAQAPRIHRDGRLTFALKAPDARSLAVAGGDGLGNGPFPMTRETDGTWSVTIDPLFRASTTTGSFSTALQSTIPEAGPTSVMGRRPV
jgi:hypothetical protein